MVTEDQYVRIMAEIQSACDLSEQIGMLEASGIHVQNTGKANGKQSLELLRHGCAERIRQIVVNEINGIGAN